MPTSPSIITSTGVKQQMATTMEPQRPVLKHFSPALLGSTPILSVLGATALLGFGSLVHSSSNLRAKPQVVDSLNHLLDRYRAGCVVNDGALFAEAHLGFLHSVEPFQAV